MMERPDNESAAAVRQVDHQSRTSPDPAQGTSYAEEDSHGHVQSGTATPVSRDVLRLHRMASHASEELGPLVADLHDDLERAGRQGHSDILDGPTALSTPTKSHSDGLHKAIAEQNISKAKGCPRRDDQACSDESEEPILLTFNRPKDPDNPYDFSRWKKIRMVILALSFALMTGLTIGLYSAQTDDLVVILGANPLELRLGISLFVWAVGVAPLVQAPFSEVYGRRWFYPISGTIYAFTFLAQVWPQNLACLLACRTIQGISGAIGNTLVAGTLADLYVARVRGWIMAWFALAIFAMIAVSVWLGDVIVINLGWKWVGWIQFIIPLALALLYIPFLPETRGNVILYHRKLRLEKETGRKYKALGEDERHQSYKTLTRKSLVRPMYMLAFEPVVQAFSLWLGFLWGLIFLLLESVPVVFAQYTSFKESSQSLAFLSLFVGASFGFLCTFHQEHLYQRDVRAARAKGQRVKPESRLYHAMAGGVGIPIGMFIFAWTGRPEYPWIAPCIGLGVVGASAFPPYMTVFSYLSDVYETYASSALACQSLLRNLGVGAFVLFAEPMYRDFPRPAGSPQSMSYALASTTLGAIAALMGCVPFLLYLTGERLRKRSKIASKIDRYLNEKYAETLQYESTSKAKSSQ